MFLPRTVSLLLYVVCWCTSFIGGSHGFVIPQQSSVQKPAVISRPQFRTTAPLQWSPFGNEIILDSSGILDLSTQILLSSVSATTTVLSDAGMMVQPPPPESAGISYSKLSYYTVLGLYLMSFPGLWSQIKRSTTAKIKRKTFVSPGEKSNSEKAMSLRQQAGEIMAYMKSNNYEVVEAGETIQFRGVVQRSLSQAFFLVFCTALGLLSLALVLQIQFPDVSLGPFNWFYLALLSPYAGFYYWSQGDRIDDCSIKLMTNEDETENEITVQGSEEELERMWRTMEWQEKGMVKVEGILG